MGGGGTTPPLVACACLLLATAVGSQPPLAAAAACAPLLVSTAAPDPCSIFPGTAAVPATRKIPALMVATYGNGSSAPANLGPMLGIDPVARGLALFVDKVLGLCSGFYCACGWREVNSVDGTPMPLYEADTRVSHSMLEAVRQTRLTGAKDFFVSDKVGLAFPIALNVQDTVASIRDNNLFVPVVQSPGLTFIKVFDNNGHSLFRALFSPAVGQIILECLAYAVLFGISIWFMERILCNNSNFPRSVVTGTAFSIFYCVDILCATGLSTAAPKSKLSRVAAVVMAWVFLLLYVSLWASVVVELQPPRSVSLAADLQYKKVAVVQGTEDEALMAAHGATAVEVQTLEEAVELLIQDEVVGIAVDMLLAGFVLNYSRTIAPHVPLVVGGGVVRHERHLGYLLSADLACQPAVLAGNMGQTLGRCMQSAAAAFSTDVQQLLAISARSLPISPMIGLDSDGANPALIDPVLSTILVCSLLLCFLVAFIHTRVVQVRAKQQRNRDSQAQNSALLDDHTKSDANAGLSEPTPTEQ